MGQDNLTKREIVLSIYEKTDIDQKTIRSIVQLTLDTISDALKKGSSVELRNFGIFEIKTRKKRIGRNPHKPETAVVIPPTTVVKFKPGKELKESIKNIAPVTSPTP